VVKTKNEVVDNDAQCSQEVEWSSCLNVPTIVVTSVPDIFDINGYSAGRQVGHISGINLNHSSTYLDLVWDILSLVKV
jgi:hypothetical protein